MAKLPPFTDPVHDRSSALAAIRARVAEGWRIDPRDGGFEAPWLEIGTPAGLAAFAAAVLLWVASAVTVFFTRGPWLLALVGAAVAATVATKILSAREVARIRRHRRESRIVLGAWVRVDDHLERPGTNGGSAQFVFDLGGGDDPEVAAELAQRVADALRRITPGDPSSVEPLGLHRIGAGNTRVRLDPEWATLPDTWYARFFLLPATLPRRAVDRPVFPLLVHPTEIDDGVTVLPPDLWWREDVEALLQPR